MHFIETWLVLIYTIPAEPSRKRAAIWRRFKQIGAVYLRDGVAVLPQRPETLLRLQEVAGKIDEFAGQATLIERVCLPFERSETLLVQFRAARQAEYHDIAQEIERFTAHLRHETEHRDFTAAEFGDLAADLGKLRRWLDQVRDRDYLGDEAADRVAGRLRLCQAELDVVLGHTGRIAGEKS